MLESAPGGLNAVEAGEAAEGDPEGDEADDNLPAEVEARPEELPFANKDGALVHVRREGGEAAQHAHGEEQP